MSTVRRLSILVPVFNEEATLHTILDAVFSAPLPEGIEREVIAVDDCSTDGSHAVLTAYQSAHTDRALRVEHHPVNRGKGAALHTAIAVASGDVCVVQDADLEYDPNEYVLLLEPILAGHADAVYGSRFMGGRPHRILFFWHSIGNRFLTFLSNMFSNLNLTDMETCYKMVRTDHLKSLDLRETRFGFEPEVTQKLSRIPDIRIYEVGISYYGRTYDEGKKIGVRDGFRAIYCILKYGVFSR